MIRSLFLVIAGIFVTGITSLYIIIVARFFRAGSDKIHNIARWWGATMLKLAGVDLEISGKENILTNGPQVFMSNHQSWFDIFIVLAGISCQFRFIAKKELFDIPVLGGALYKYDAIPIDRKNYISAMRSIDAAARRVRDGKSIMTFPEGTRSADGKVQPFKTGVFHLALRSGVPIVPISICGASDIMPKQSLRVQPDRVRIVIGAPIPVTGFAVENMDDLVERVSRVIIENCETGKKIVAGS